MSLILKGIDLPTNGETLIVGIYGNGLVSVEHSKPLVLAVEPNAKAIQIPKGHGKLIDEKELKTKIHDVTLEGGALHGCIDKTVLHEVPTILAEEG